MSEINRPLAAAMRAMAETASLPNERLAYLQNALKLDPSDEMIVQEIAEIETKLDGTVSYVAIEKAVIIGSAVPDIEGCIYILQPDRSLKPLDGQELRAFHEAHPNFVKNWSLKA
jgi:hypothetical protein